MKRQSAFDVHETITNSIIAAIENGPGEFTMPWHRAATLELPLNAVTEKGYRGINVLSLWIGAQVSGYTTPKWATFKQWQAAGAQVRKGERGTPIIFYKQLELENREAPDNEARRIPFARASWVFNAQQVDGYECEQTAAIPKRQLFERLQDVESAIAATKATIGYGGSRAYYQPSQDRIQMPNAEAFTGSPTSTAQESFYSTLLHELSHWAGAKHRLAREDHKKPFDNIYAFEEVVAELSAAFLCARLGIASIARPDHAQYINCYLKMLKEDKRAIFRAATAAAAATDYIMAFSDDDSEDAA